MSNKILKLILAIGLTASPIVGVQSQNYRTGIRIGWDFDKQKFENPGGYGRVKLLKDGRQALVYDEGGVCKIRFKQPKGKAFQAPIVVSRPPAGAGYTNAELLELEDGTLMYAWNHRWDTKIKVCYSYDGGYTWEDEAMLFDTPASGYLNNEGPAGVWEPAMIQLPSGEVQIYFANEYQVPNNDQNITIMRSTSATEKGARRWQRQSVVACYTVGARDGMPVPLVLQNDRGIALAIEDDGHGGGFQPAIIHTSLEDNWTSGIRYGNSSDRWIAVAAGEPRGGGAPYLIQLKTGETILSTQTNSLADTRNAPWDDMYKFRQFVYVGNAMARNFQCYSIPFPFMDEPDQGGVWNSLCQINDSTIMAVSEVHGHPTSNGIWTNEGRIMHPLTSYQVDNGTDIDWKNSMSEIFIGSQSQADMTVGSSWTRDSLFLHFVVEDKSINSPDEGAVIWDADAVEFFYDVKRNTTNNIPAGVYKFLVNIDGSTLVSRSTGSGWQDLAQSVHGMTSKVERTAEGYIVDMALPWGRIGRRPANGRFTGYFLLHNKDIRNGRTYIYHEALSGIDVGRTETWWEFSLGKSVAIENIIADEADQMVLTGEIKPNSNISISLGDRFAQDSAISIIEMTGRTLSTSEAIDGKGTVQLPAMPGMLIVRAHDNQGNSLSRKILVR